MTPAVFLDLGGTLLALDDRGEIAYTADGAVTILPGVTARLATLAPTPVLVVTNQSGLADGTLSHARLQAAFDQLTAATGHTISGYAVCPHPRDGGCRCRKPRPGLVHDLAAGHHIDLAASIMVGDTDVDRQLAANAGIATFHWAHDYFAYP